ncbi:MAG: alanine dehydrogenase [Dysosmobacter sp.]
MVIGVLKEIKGNEYRVAAVPATVHEIVRHGHTVYVETGAGVASGFSDAQYEAAGAIIADTNTVWEKADLYYKVKELFPQEFKWMNKDKILFTYIHSNAHPDETDTLLNSHVSAVAYEDVQDEEGKFPLLRPMSELAGKGGFLAALHFAQSVNGGPGKLLANVTGVETPIITMLGCGVVGTGAAELVAAFGNEVRILDVNMNTMLAAKKTSPANITYMISNRSNLEKCLRESDVIINGILWAKDRKDHIVYREDLKLMKPGAMIVDVACDENGAIETCRDTTHDDPIYFVDGVMHYCVDNIPSAFSQTASVTLANATLPYLLQMADKGFKKAMEDNRLLRLGMTCYDGKLTLKETAPEGRTVSGPTPTSWSRSGKLFLYLITSFHYSSSHGVLRCQKPDAGAGNPRRVEVPPGRGEWRPVIFLYHRCQACLPLFIDGTTQATQATTNKKREIT